MWATTLQRTTEPHRWSILQAHASISRIIHTDSSCGILQVRTDTEIYRGYVEVCRYSCFHRFTIKEHLEPLLCLIQPFRDRSILWSAGKTNWTPRSRFRTENLFPLWFWQTNVIWKIVILMKRPWTSSFRRTTASAGKRHIIFHSLWLLLDLGQIECEFGQFHTTIVTERANSHRHLGGREQGLFVPCSSFPLFK